jgi:hypothetical protein
MMGTSQEVWLGFSHTMYFECKKSANPLLGCPLSVGMHIEARRYNPSLLHAESLLPSITVHW